MRPVAIEVLRRLAGGGFHSGEALAGALGISRGSVWNAVRGLEAAGLEVYRVHGRGYRLARPVSLLDAAEIARHLGPGAGRFSIEVRATAVSTSTALLERAGAGAPSGAVLAVEWQSGGRGRLGRPWHSDVGGALTFSLLWRFAQGGGALSGLSLAVGVALVRALAAYGARGAALKWPNDVLWRGGKLAGILTELQGDALGPTAAVIGVGLNVRLSAAARARIGQAAADLEAVLGEAPDRNALLARLLAELHDVLEGFAVRGFAPLRAEWERHHSHRGRRVTLLAPGGVAVSGRARGVAEDGAFLLETRSGLWRFHSGEVSLRPDSSRTRNPVMGSG